jgi:hypothetical protein
MIGREYFILTRPYSDPFTSMVRLGKKYGFSMALRELSNTAPGLFRAVSGYKKAHSISSTPMWKAMIDASWVPWPFRLLLRPLKGRNSEGDAWNWCHFWSNFEIGSLDWLRSRQYRQLFEYLDQQKGFYHERVSISSVLPLLKTKLTLASGAMRQFIPSLPQCYFGRKRCITLKMGIGMGDINLVLRTRRDSNFQIR